MDQSKDVLGKLMLNDQAFNVKYLGKIFGYKVEFWWESRLFFRI